ncbi:MmgE/PrpD family protein [Bordetella sp. BOR01]|uniref:MmgE/PrpD family protein n=1 Tax=Bordetella sp. BOR01 TaxID=2854779 RepID=UPI001DFC2320|nr:MmgE/PrpD family protein [Bordetella sp. BOR01]MBV7486826.1 MmgE/PrpD family protein [Bordetella sp. BOR01]
MQANPILPVTQALADFVANLTWEKLPAAVQEEGRLAIADTIGGAIAAVDEPVTRTVLAIIEGEPGPSAIWGTTLRTTPRNAALVNGAMAHAHDIDDTNPSMRGHPSCPVVPALFALAAKSGSTGQELVTAYVAGVEVATKLGRAVNMTHYNKGWHTTLTLGTLGAAAACANLLKLDADKTAIALAIAGSRAGGLVANFGTMTKPVHAGFAAEGGVTAALLAQAGTTANPAALEAENGFFDLFVGLDKVEPALALEALNERFDLVDPGNIYKQYPTCSLTHCAIDMLLDGLADGTIKTDQIESIECAVGYRCESTLPYHDARTGLQGKFSMEYCLAAALAYGQVTFAEFEDSKVLAPAIADIHQKIKLYTHPDLTTPESVPDDFTDIVIKHRDGSVFHGREQKAKGDPAKRWTLEQFKAKFVQCCAPILGTEQAGKLWDDLHRLDALPTGTLKPLI